VNGSLAISSAFGAHAHEDYAPMPRESATS
jgi:hypothetical protein